MAEINKLEENVGPAHLTFKTDSEYTLLLLINLLCWTESLLRNQ